MKGNLEEKQEVADVLAFFSPRPNQDVASDLSYKVLSYISPIFLAVLLLSLTLHGFILHLLSKSKMDAINISLFKTQTSFGIIYSTSLVALALKEYGNYNAYQRDVMCRLLVGWVVSSDFAVSLTVFLIAVVRYLYVMFPLQVQKYPKKKALLFFTISLVLIMHYLYIVLYDYNRIRLFYKCTEIIHPMNVTVPADSWLLTAWFYLMAFILYGFLLTIKRRIKVTGVHQITKARNRISFKACLSQTLLLGTHLGFFVLWFVDEETSLYVVGFLVCLKVINLTLFSPILLVFMMTSTRKYMERVFKNFHG